MGVRHWLGCRLGGVLVVVDTAAGRVVDTIAVDGMPTRDPGGNRAYLVDGDRIAIVNVVKRQVIDHIAVGRPVSCIAVSRDDSCLYVGDYDGTVTAFFCASLRPHRVLTR